jgi:hypothetical protein
MTLLFSENSVIDDELCLLKGALELYDTKIVKIDEEIKTSKYPDEDLFDTCEYYIGLGFIAIQCYFDAIINQFKISKKDALEVAPKYEDQDATFAELINAGANHAKHQNEWWKSWYSNTKRAQNAQNNVESICKISQNIINYPKSEILALILDQECKDSFKLSQTIPIIEQWRDAVINLSKNNVVTVK